MTTALTSIPVHQDDVLVAVHLFEASACSSSTITGGSVNCWCRCGILGAVLRCATARAAGEEIGMDVGRLESHICSSGRCWPRSRWKGKRGKKQGMHTSRSWRRRRRRRQGPPTGCHGCVRLLRLLWRQVTHPSGCKQSESLCMYWLVVQARHARHASVSFKDQGHTTGRAGYGDTLPLLSCRRDPKLCSTTHCKIVKRKTPPPRGRDAGALDSPTKNCTLSIRTDGETEPG